MKRLDSYQVKVNDILVKIDITIEDKETIPRYNISILNISKTTELILKKIRDEFVSRINISEIDFSEGE